MPLGLRRHGIKRHAERGVLSGGFFSHTWRFIRGRFLSGGVFSSGVLSGYRRNKIRCDDDGDRHEATATLPSSVMSYMNPVAIVVSMNLID